MGFLDRAIKNGISNGIRKGIGDAVGKAVTNAIEPRATKLANEAADNIEKNVRENGEEIKKNATEFEKSINRLNNAINDYEKVYAKEEITQNIKRVIDNWEQNFPHYPKWTCGGNDFDMTIEDGYQSFTPTFNTYEEAVAATNEYRIILKQNGFEERGEYPSIEHLYKMIDDKCYHVDTEHMFEGDKNMPTIYFNIAEPTGGYNYVKPEEKKSSFFGLFK